MFNQVMAEHETMRRGTAGAALLALLAPGLAACGRDWQPSWETSSRPAVTGDSLTVRRVIGEDPEVEPLRREDPGQLRLYAGALRSNRPESPEAAARNVPEYRPVPRPDLDRQVAPPRDVMPAPAPRSGSSTPPPVASVPPSATLPPRPPVAAQQPEPREREEGRVVTIPGQPPAVTTGGTGRVQSIVQPGNPAGGVAIRDGGTTTVIQPGGRVTTVPTPR